MSYAIVYSSRTGNTEMLAQALRNALPQEDCVYYGTPDVKALAAERLYVGFWTDKGSCDAQTAAFLARMSGKEVFLFGTAGFGGESAYFKASLRRVEERLGSGNTVIGTYMCQGKMPGSVRERYEKMLSDPAHASRAQAMIDNFDSALSHPDAQDLRRLVEAAANGR